MTGPDGIKIVLFHQCQIFFDLFYTCNIPCLRICIMMIDTAQFDLLPVKIYNRIFDRNRPESDPVHDHFVLCL